MLQSLSSQELQLVLLYNHAQTEKKEQGRVQTAEWYLYIWYLVRLAEEERYKLFYLTFTIYIVMILWNPYIIFDGNFVFPLILHSQNTDVNARATCRWEHQPGCPLITLIVHWSSEVPIILYFWSIATSCSYLFLGKLQFYFLSIGQINRYYRSDSICFQHLHYSYYQQYYIRCRIFNTMIWKNILKTYKDRLWRNNDNGSI